MRVYELVGYYDLQFQKWALTLPKFWIGRWRVKIRRRHYARRRNRY